MKKWLSAVGRTGFVVCVSLLCAESQARFTFEPGFFRTPGSGGNEDIDLSLFNQGATFPPGHYRLAVYVNDEFMMRRDIRFIRTQGGGDPSPCLSLSDLVALGITLPPAEVPSDCQDPAGLLRWETDISTRQLKLTLPQLYLQRGEYFKTPWQSWQDGSSALLANYDYNYSETQGQGRTDNSQYLGMQGGLNLLGWRLRNESSWSRSGRGDNGLTSLRTYLQRDYHWGQGGEFTAGQIWSEGSLFNSIPFKGVMLSSRDDMLKSEFRDYMPEIRGVVNSQAATVRVIKNGRVVSQMTVPSGPFSLPGIMSNGGGDYRVEITEADGSVRTYTQSADSLPEMVTKGRLKYSVVSGNTDITAVDNRHFSQASLFWGATDRLTLYGGTILSDGYAAYSLGTGWRADGLGAVSADLTLSSAGRLPAEGTANGHSVRASWYRDFDATATSFGLFAYRYSSEKYMEFEEYLNVRRQGANPLNKKNRVEISLNQKLGEYGSLSVSGRRENYWSGEKSLTGVRVNHHTGLGPVALNTYYDQSRTLDNREDKIFGLSVSFALSEKGRGVSVSSRLVRDNGRLASQNTITASPAEDGRFSLSASAGKTEGESGMQGLQGNYSGNLTELSAGYYNSAETRRLSAGLRGGLVVHGNGITAGRRLSMDAPLAIVSIPGVSGVKVSNRTNTKTDYFGNALVSSLQPYQQNQIGIDVTSLDDGVEAGETDRTIIPSGGSVIPVRFDVATGARALFTVMYRNRPVPLGAVASVNGSNDQARTAFFADQGQVYLTGLTPTGNVRVSWGRGSCRFDYDTGRAGGKALYNRTVECR